MGELAMKAVSVNDSLNAATEWDSLPAAESIRVFAAGEEIHAQGGKADRIYRVEFGMVCSYLLTSEGRRLVREFHLPGEYFGLDTEGTRQFFADAISTTGLLPVPWRRIGNLDPDVVEAALQTHVRVEQRLLLIRPQNAIQRMALFLLDISERMGKPDLLELPMSRADIGDHIDLSVETVSRVVSRLRASGHIDLVSPRIIRITNRKMLEALCSS